MSWTATTCATGYAPTWVFREGSRENIRRIGEVAKLFADAGVICVTAFISLTARTAKRSAKPAAGQFVEVYLNVRSRSGTARLKGLYAKARAGKLRGFTGVSAPYEPPTTPKSNCPPLKSR